MRPGVPAEARQRLHCRSGAFDVRLLGHALSEHLRWIDPLQEAAAAPSFVGSESAVGILPGEDELRGPRQAVGGNAFFFSDQARPLVRRKDGGQGLRGAIAHRPPMPAIAETPSAAYRIARLPAMAVQLLGHLRLTQEVVSAAQA